jgi:3-hydroxyacyl-CoA dehydrogenase
MEIKMTDWMDHAAKAVVGALAMGGIALARRSVSHGEKIAALETSQADDRAALTRIEGKLDRLIEREAR